MSENRDPTEESPGPAVTHAAPAHRSHGGGGHGGGGHGGEEPHEGAPEWMISFADNVMLQMGFFVILLGIALKGANAGGLAKEGNQRAGGGSPTPEQLDFAIAIRDAFNNPVDVDSANPDDFLLVQRLRQRAGGLSDAVQDGLKGAEHDVQSIRLAGAYGVGGLVPFEAHSNQLGPKGREAAETLGEHFRGCQTTLELRGHCSAAEAYGQDDHGMRLSYERAVAVAQVLVSKGLAWNQLRLTACADNERVTSPSYDDAAHRSNQRVEVIEIDEAAIIPPEPGPAGADGN